jgi:hypothetical protein
VAIRRAVRTGDAEGVLIEDAGIAGQPYAMTERDVLAANRDLIERCGQLLSAQPGTGMRVTARGGRLTVRTSGLDRLDLFGDGQPARPTLRLARDGAHRLPVPAGAHVVEVVGFGAGTVRQRRRLALDGRARRSR